MNSRKLSNEKRNKLVLVGLVAAIAVAALYFFLIQRQREHLATLADQKAAAARKLQTARDAIDHTDRIRAELDEVKGTLAEAERDVASGDLYAWVINLLNKFKGSYKNVQIPQFSQLGPVTDVNILPSFPYKQAILTIAGTARFHDLGRFLADFENEYPHIRLLNLSVEANATGVPTESEILSFKLDIVTLVKLNPS